MTAYRKRFILFNMLLIGFVLIFAFTALGIFLYRSELNNLEKTMGLVVEPWDAPSIRERGERPPEDPAQTAPPDKPPFEGHGQKGGRPMASDGIMTLFYDSAEQKYSVLSSRFSLDESTVARAVEKVLASEKDFGFLSSEGLIYKREGINGGMKIALADSAYISSRMLRNTVLLGVVFIGAMGLFFLISLWLSRLASRPMEQALDMERQFVADLSHDLKTPVTVVLANNSILRASPEATVGEQEQWISSTDEAAHSMMELVDQMLTLSKLDLAAEKPEKTPSELSPVSLSMAAEKCVLQMESVAYDRGVELTSDIMPELTAVTDAQSVEKLMSGLIENALKYEPDGGKVHVSLARSRVKRRKLIFCVKNFGSFIDESDIGHIFERFYRGDKARSEKGHGLGLPILKRTAELIGAELSVESDRENGTVFTLAIDEQGKTQR